MTYMILTITTYHTIDLLCKNVHTSTVHNSVLVLSTRWDLIGSLPAKRPCRHSSTASMSCSVAIYESVPTYASPMRLHDSFSIFFFSFSHQQTNAVPLNGFLAGCYVGGGNGPGREKLVEGPSRPPSMCIRTYITNLRIQTLFSKID